MNKVLLMGRLTKDPEARYSQTDNPVAVVRYSLAVNRRFKREGEPDADFINCVAFGKTGEFAEKYFKKGLMISIVGNLRVSSWDDQNGQKRWNTDVIVEEQYFAESKNSFESHKNTNSKDAFFKDQGSQDLNQMQSPSGFTPISESIDDDDDLPF